MKYIHIFLFLGILSGVGSCKNKDKDITPKDQAVLDETIPATIPHIYINIEGDQEVVSKDDYLNATISITGNGYPVIGGGSGDFETASTRIKGRGNSTWGKPKKPYRLKLDNTASILGLHPAKDWVLLANYQDYTLMTNAVAMKAGQQLGLPYTNTIIPVDLTINGQYRGSYNLTQQIEAKEGRVDIGDDGVLLELDNHFDEDFQFKSKGTQLPVMIKNPDITSDAQFNTIKNEFEAFEELLFAANFPDNGYGNFIDKKQVVNYLIVNNLVGNLEINHPKSVYIHKKAGGLYTMGPIWDFDWAYGISESVRTYFHRPNVDLLDERDDRIGARFLARFMKDPEIKSLYKQQWAEYRSAHFDNLLQYIEEYAARIRESQKKDYEIWQLGTNNLPQYKDDMKNYLRKRANHIDSYVQAL